MEIFKQQNDSIIISEENLDLYWKMLTFNDSTIESNLSKIIFFDEFERYNIAHNSSFNFNTNGWVVYLKSGLIKSAIFAPALYGLLNYLGITSDLPSIIVPTIIPLLFEIEQIKISKEEEEVLINLRSKVDDKKYYSEEELYYSLSNNIRKQISFLSFKNFVDKFYSGGLITKNTKDKFMVAMKGRGKFKIVFN